MKKFWEFLKNNVIWAVIGTLIYWASPYIVVVLLGLVNPWFFTTFIPVFTVQVMLPAIPIIIAIGLGIKGIFYIFKKKSKKHQKSVDKDKNV